MAHIVDWFEIPSTDFDRAVGFYSTIFDQTIPTEDFVGIPHGFLSDADGLRYGAIIHDAATPPGNAGTLIYFHADNLDHVLGRVEAAGGTIAMPKQDLGEIGKIAVVLDTEGNRIGLHAA